MTSGRITKRLIDGLKATGAEQYVWDSELSGFGVRVQPSGAASYVVIYRVGTDRSAAKRRTTLGSTDKLIPDQARMLAKRA